MVACRLRLLVLASLCGLACALVSASFVTVAWGATQIGETGTGPGELYGPLGVGIDQASGDLYVGEYFDERVSKFDGSGAFQLAWGWKVNEEHPANELQTCTDASGCLEGESGSGAGEFAGGCGAAGVAIDNEPSSASYHDVYVADLCHNRVEKFDPSGKFLLMFGKEVNQAKDGAPGATEAEKNVCVAGEACTSGVAGAGDGAFEWAFERSTIAAGPGGRVYVGDKARVQVFEPSGAWRESISLAALSGTGKVTTLAVDSSGDVFLADEGVTGVREFEPGGIEKATQFDAGSSSVEAIALGEAGDLFVADGSGGFHIAEYDSSGVQLAGFGFNTISHARGLAFSRSSGEVYATYFGSVWAFSPPAPGPSIESESERATAELRGAASFEAVIDPEGNATTYHVEYVDEKRFSESGYADATSTSPQLLGSGFGEERAEVHLPAGTLTPGVTYHWRMVAVDSLNRSSVGPDQSLEEIPAALLDGPWASDVAATSATLSARIDPQGASTSYRLEYGSGGEYEHAFSGNVGEGEGYVSIADHVQGLQPRTVYRYRLITESSVGSVEVVHSFTTQVANTELALPDGRAWELVSPPNKKAAVITPSPRPSGLWGYWLTQAASDGSGITYTVHEPLGEGAAGHIFAAQILSTHTASGWRTQDVAARAGIPPEGESAKILFEANELWPRFSEDLATGLYEPGSQGGVSQSAEAPERTLYVRDNGDGEFQPLENEADVPSGVRYGDPKMQYFTATPDLSHVIFGSKLALARGAVEEACTEGGCLNLYEWHAGRLELVNVLPDGTSKPGAIAGNFSLAASGGGMVAHAVSDDGRWVVWKYGEPRNGKIKLYVRDMVEKRTLRVGGPFARFETMSSDGSKVFYVETESSADGSVHGINGDLHVFYPKTDTQIDLTSGHPSDERSAGVQNAVLGASRDGSYIYFVATGVLANGAVLGKDNLYLAHEEAGGWKITLVATLTQEDEHTWGGTEDHDPLTGPASEQRPWLVDSEVSPNGRYVAFMSNSSLTGYDNRDAISDQPDEEVYLYDAVGGRLGCISCDPSGARPVGVFDQGESAGSEPLLMDMRGAWAPLGRHTKSHWLAASLVGWNNTFNVASYQPRFVSDHGRVFFNSPDALVSQDTNGLADVYEYEPTGIGDCASGNVSFDEAAGGCVSLISSGQSSSESAFMDASETGNDVFFVTSERLVGEDYDTAYDIYDAHVCTSEAPCNAQPVSPPECTSGDSCKAAPSPQPAIFGPAPSATFKGDGNVTTSPATVVKPRSLTRAQRLARALRSCRAQKPKRRRRACERSARRRYGAKSAAGRKAAVRKAAVAGTVKRASKRSNG